MDMTSQAFWYFKMSTLENNTPSEMSISRKTNRFLKFCQSAYLVLLIKQHTCKVSTLRRHKQKRPLSYSNFSHQTQHPLYKLEVGSRNHHKTLIYSLPVIKVEVLKGGSLFTTSLQVHGFFVPRGITERNFMVGQPHMLIALNFCILVEKMLTEDCLIKVLPIEEV